MGFDSRWSAGGHAVRLQQRERPARRRAVDHGLERVEHATVDRQAIRRMQQQTLSPEEAERVGKALMVLEKTVHEIAGKFGLSPEELNLDLGPLGKLM